LRFCSDGEIYYIYYIDMPEVIQQITPLEADRLLESEIDVKVTELQGDVVPCFMGSYGLILSIRGIGLRAS
jgi:hypothetical protein